MQLKHENYIKSRLKYNKNSKIKNFKLSGNLKLIKENMIRKQISLLLSLLFLFNMANASDTPQQEQKKRRHSARPKHTAHQGPTFTDHLQKQGLKGFSSAVELLNVME
jgi:hypothetical protein